MSKFIFAHFEQKISFYVLSKYISKGIPGRNESLCVIFPMSICQKREDDTTFCFPICPNRGFLRTKGQRVFFSEARGSKLCLSESLLNENVNRESHITCEPIHWLLRQWETAVCAPQLLRSRINTWAALSVLFYAHNAPNRCLGLPGTGGGAGGAGGRAKLNETGAIVAPGRCGRQKLKSGLESDPPTQEFVLSSLSTGKYVLIQKKLFIFFSFYLIG